MRTPQEQEKLNNEIWERNEMTKVVVLMIILPILYIACALGALWIVFKIIRLFI